MGREGGRKGWGGVKGSKRKGGGREAGMGWRKKKRAG